MSPTQPRRAGASRLMAGVLAAATALGGPATLRAQPAASAPSGVRLPALGDAGTDDLTLGDERRLGEQIMREARRDPDLLDDPVLLEYVQSLWQPLLAAARARGDIDAESARLFPWELFLVRDRSVNAFALPGGYVGVHLGLIAITGNRDQLASVLAHEMSHVSQRHIARSMGNARNASLLSVAAMLLGVLAASRSNNVDVANAAIMGGQGAALQGQLNFSRDMEREADRIGFAVLSGAGFSAAGMSQMFERLDGSAAVSDSGAFPYLRTHPLTVERISEARNRVLLAHEPAPAATLQHQLMQMRARVLMDRNPQALQRLAGGATSSSVLGDRIAALYGGALAQIELGQGQRAEAMAIEAQGLAAGASPRDSGAERALALLQTQTRLAQGDGPGALRLLEPFEAARATRPVLLMHAQAALRLPAGERRTAELRQSTQALQVWVAEYPQDAHAWELLSSTADAIGQKLRSLRAGAEARAGLGDLSGAIDRLRAAQASARSATGQEFIEASVIDARLRQLQNERRQIALEAARGNGRGGGGEPPPR